MHYKTPDKNARKIDTDKTQKNIFGKTILMQLAEVFEVCLKQSYLSIEIKLMKPSASTKQLIVCIILFSSETVFNRVVKLSQDNSRLFTNN